MEKWSECPRCKNEITQRYGSQQTRYWYRVCNCPKYNCSLCTNCIDYNAVN